MNRMQKTTMVFGILALALILVGCSTPTIVAPPTPDIPSVRTEAAKTIVAKITIEAALQPTATSAPTMEPEVITATALPSPTTAPAIQIPTATLIPTLKPATGGGGLPAPTATRRAGPDQAQLITQDPKDGTAYSAGYEFDGTWTFKNIGTSTWTTGYEYRFSDGTNLAKKKIYTVPKSVAPGESVTLATDMVTPVQAGRYTSYWQLVNENGDVFYEFFIIIDVK
ncbi:MAG: hypothetical protein IH586_05590 [Anaerolineaceae bacterium]|nr:hypothetical protein [Anaerolineaceae bacterium]